MSSLFGRLKTIFSANVNAAVDTAEAKEPAVMQAEAIRELEDQLQKGVNAEVSLKTLVIEKQTKATNKQAEADQWAEKANKLLDQAGASLSQEDADKFAAEALTEQQTAQHEADSAKSEAEGLQNRLTTLEEKVRGLKTEIQNLKSHAADLKSREETANAEIGINKELADYGKENSAHEILDRVEAHVSHLENESKALSALQTENKTDKQKIDEALANAAKVSPSDALAALKKAREEKTTN